MTTTPTRPAPPYLAFTDVDETLIHCKSMFEFLDHYLFERDGRCGLERARAVRQHLLRLSADGLPREEANRIYYRSLTGEPVTAVNRSARRWFAARSADDGFFVASTLAALDHHRTAGAALVLVSGSFPAVLRPLAEWIGAEHLLCTRPEVRDGHFTGEVVGPPAIGEAKHTALRLLLHRYPHIDASDCYGYGDHISDLPMLAEVGHPVVVGDDRALAGLLHSAPALRDQLPPRNDVITM
ncbi:HAD family hydrolase [Streptomyces sp. NPDC058221]|uniref:HAD family hydrolase n=1 Tax=Streptomyces sp. NPDC058221 TaxID=3346388 RepID=UPI0036E3778E